MLPTAGLFLPETLHRADLPTSAPTETDGTRLRYFQRKIGRPKLEPSNSEDLRPSTAIPRDTPDDLSRDFPAIPTTYYFADYVLSSEKASTETIAFVSIIQQVRQDIEEATRLSISSAVSNFLDAYPSKRRWIEDSLLEVRRALNDIGMDMDTAWGHEGDGGTVASKRKLEWGLKNQKRLLKKKQQLDRCHTQLTGAIYVMQTAELCGKPGSIAQDPIFEAPVRPWVPHDEKDALRGPYSRQKNRTASHTSLFASNVTLASEAEKHDVETTVGVPMVARRYRATSIDIQRHTEKHRSLPSELPYLKSQPSLIDDLAGYVLPSAVSDKLPSREWTASPTLSVPSISLTSSPTIGHALPVVPETTSTADTLTSSPPNLATEAAEVQLPFRQLMPSSTGPIQYSQHERRDTDTLPACIDVSSSRRTSSDSAEHATTPSSYYATSLHTLRSPSSLVNVTIFTDDEPVRRPSSQRPSQRMSKRMSQTSSSRSVNAASSPTITTVAETLTAPIHSEEVTHQDATSPAVAPLPSPRMITEDASQPTSVNPAETPEQLNDDDVMLSVLQQRLCSHKPVKTMAEDLVRQASATEAAHQVVDTEQPILSPPVWQEQPTSTSKPDLQVDVIPPTSPPSVQVAASSVPSNGSQNGDGEKKPMSAQAKRRAAHARRMQLAFGDGSTA
ncbi:unnamed protein product [Alternaria alternata]